MNTVIAGSAAFLFHVFRQSNRVRYDRYGLENADKCKNTFGETYLTSNGARANANVRFGARDYLIQQNWVNDRKPRCAMSR